jgi:hypothetical protein
VTLHLEQNNLKRFQLLTSPESRRQSPFHHTSSKVGNFGPSEVVVLLGEREVLGFVHLLLVLVQNGLVDLHFWRSKGRSSDELQGLVADELSGEPPAHVRRSHSRWRINKDGLQERLLEVVVGLGRDVVVLQVLLSVEGDGLGLDLALLHINLVAAEDDGDVLADSDEIAYTESVKLKQSPWDIRCQLGTFL